MSCNENIAAAVKLIRILQLDGLWYWPCEPHRHPFYRRLRRWHPYLLHVPITFIFVSLMTLQLFTFDTFDQAANQLPMIITELTMLFKFHSFWRYRTQTHAFIEEFVQNPVFHLRKSERAFWLNKHRSFARVAFIYMSGCGMVCAACLYAMLRPYRYELLFPYYVVYDWHNPRTCWFVYIYELLGMALTCITNITMDMMACYFIFHLAMMYKLIGIRMEGLRQLREVEVVKELRGIWQLHQQVRNRTKDCELFISASVLSQIVVNSFVLCFTIYYLQGQSLHDNPGHFFAMLQFINVTILQIFLPCYYANQLTVASEGLLNALYGCNWEDYSVPTRKLVNLYMEFLKIPVRLKTGNFFILGLPIFSKTMNNAYSLCALLLNMSETQEEVLENK